MEKQIKSGIQFIICVFFILALFSAIFVNNSMAQVTANFTYKGILKDANGTLNKALHQRQLHKNTILNQDAAKDSNVTLIGRWTTNGYCLAVVVTGDTAYIGNGGYFEIIDITNPSKPVLMGKVFLPSLVFSISISGNYAYIADGYAGLRIIDVSNPAEPKEVGFSRFNSSIAYDVYINGKYAYVAYGDAGLRIIDVSNPAKPTETGFFDTKSFASGVYVSGDHAYVADWSDGLRIIDVSNPAKPTETGFFDTWSFANNVYISGNYAYVADWGDGLRIIDVSNPTMPKEVGSFYSFNTWGVAYGVYINGKYAYVAYEDAGLRIIDVSNPAEPTEAGFFDTKSLAMDVYVSGKYVYVADYDDGLYILRTNLITDVNNNKSNIPRVFILKQNYPNPFNPTTTIKYNIPKSTYVTLKVYNIAGQLVATLVNEQKTAGRYSVTWNAENISSGIYFYRITAGNFSDVKKCIILK